MGTSFRRHLESALASLARECPAHHRRVREAVGPRGVRLVVDGESVVLRFVEQRDSVDVECVTSRAAIVALGRGELTVEQAIWTDQVRLRGRLDDLIALHDALMAYVHGAVRAPSSTVRFARFAAGLDPPGDSVGG